MEGRNAIDKVPRRKVKRKKNLAVLTPDEAKALLFALDPRWRGIVATALFPRPTQGRNPWLAEGGRGPCEP